MCRIYSNARSVAIWIGESKHGSLNEIADQILYDSGYVHIVGGCRPLPSLWDMVQVTAVSSPCNSTYRRRLWIVQEAVLERNVRIWLSES
jgi:hypothetical protein